MIDTMIHTITNVNATPGIFIAISKDYGTIYFQHPSWFELERQCEYMGMNRNDYYIRQVL